MGPRTSECRSRFSGRCWRPLRRARDRSDDGLRDGHDKRPFRKLTVEPDTKHAAGKLDATGVPRPRPCDFGLQQLRPTRNTVGGPDIRLIFDRVWGQERDPDPATSTPAIRAGAQLRATSLPLPPGQKWPAEFVSNRRSTELMPKKKATTVSRPRTARIRLHLCDRGRFRVQRHGGQLNGIWAPFPGDSFEKGPNHWRAEESRGRWPECAAPTNGT